MTSPSPSSRASVALSRRKAWTSLFSGQAMTSHDYMGYTWHIQHPWVTQTWMDREKAENWPAKQRILVDSGVCRIITLQSHPAVRSVTAILGPQNGDFYNLPEEYDREARESVG